MSTFNPVRQWLLGCTVAEAAGIALVALTYALIDRGHLTPAAPFILGAGAWEGLCIGMAQARVLRRFGANAGLWVALTMIAAVAGYALSLLGGAGANGNAGAPEPALWLILAAGAGAGLGMGLVMGLIQAPALPRGVRVRHWVALNAVGWVGAMTAIMAGAGLATLDWSLWQVAGVGAASGAVAGAAVGGATLLGLRSVMSKGAST